MSKNLKSENDIVFTDAKFAKRIIEYFSSQFKQDDIFFDPCKGTDGYDKSGKPGGAFYLNLPEPRYWCEITEGRDCLDFNLPVQWIFTNPPFSAKAYRSISQHAFDISENVVFLIRLDLAIGTYARQNDYRSRGHGLKEVIICKYDEAGFAQKGFALAVLHWQKNYNGGTNWTYWL